MRKLIKKVAKYIVYHVFPEKWYVKIKFKKRMGYVLDLESPKTLNEKIQWLKLYDRTELHTICADKIAVRDYVREKIGENYLIPLIYTTTEVENLSMSDFPNYPIIVKTNHDSGSYRIVKTKENLDLDNLKKYFSEALSRNYYYKSKEWQYKNIKPQLLIEKLLIDNKYKTPLDYKIHCFGGKPRMIQVDLDRGTAYHSRNWYNINWEIEEFYWSSLLKGNETLPSDKIVDKPLNLDKMLDLSGKLSEDFSYVRIDWYDCNDELFFGEITFHHDSGYRPVTPLEWDIKLGELIKLPK